MLHSRVFLLSLEGPLTQLDPNLEITSLFSFPLIVLNAH